MKFKISSKALLFELGVIFYFFIMTLSSSAYTLLDNVSQILSAFRLLVLLLLLIIAFSDTIRLSLFHMIIIMIFVAFSLGNMVFSGGGYKFIIILLFVLIARKYSQDLVFKIAFVGLMASSVLVIISSICGIIPDLANERVVDSFSFSLLSGKYVRHSYGFLMSNIIPFILSYLYMYRIVQKKETMTLIEVAIFQLANVLSFLFCGSRVVFLTITVIGVVHLYLLLKGRTAISFLYNNKLIAIMFPLLTIGCFIIALLFGREAYNTVNIMFNFRFSNIYKTIIFFGIHLIGNENNVGTQNSLNGVVVDNGYAMLFLQKGLIVGIIIIGAWALLTIKAIKLKNAYLIIALFGIALLNVVDYHFTSYMNVPFYCLLLQKNNKCFIINRLDELGLWKEYRKK